MPISLATNALLETATLETELGIAAGTMDDVLNRIINRVSDQIQNYIGRELYYEEDIAESITGSPSTILQVKRTPMHSIASITYDGSTIDSSNYEIHSTNAGQIYRPSGWTWTAEVANSPSGDPLPGTERKLYVVTYTAGYITAKQETDGAGSRTLPWDIEDAATMLAVMRYRQIGKSLGVQEESLLSGRIRYFDSANASIPQSIKDILDTYADVAMV